MKTLFITVNLIGVLISFSLCKLNDIREMAIYDASLDVGFYERELTQGEVDKLYRSGIKSLKIMAMSELRED